MGAADGEPAIRVEGLHRGFGHKEVLRGVDFTVRPGEIYGYIGPNGAGKSTTVKILVGLLGGFRGKVEVAGFEVARHPLEVKARIGYVPENAELYEALTAGEFLELVGRLHDLDDRVSRRRAEEILAAFELETRIDSRIGSLSKGMRQKVLLTSALLHDPDVLFLDEPLSGLDVNASMFVKDLLRALANSGKAVFYCSHVMDVVERVCDRIAILNEGAIVAQGSFDELSRASAGGSLERIFAELTSRGGEEERVRRVLDALA